MKTTPTMNPMPRRGRNRLRAGIRAGAALACAILLAGCSGGDVGAGKGGFLGFGGGDDRELVATDLGRGYVDGATTTIVAPPGWEGDAGATVGSDEAAKKDDGGGGLFGFGRRPKGDLSQVTEASVSSFCSASSCTVDSIDIDHPKWGPTRVFSLIDSAEDSRSRPILAAVDAAGEIRWTYTFSSTYPSAWGFAAEEPDADQAVYLTYNPGRYDGIIALHPTDDGFHSLPDGGDDSDYQTGAVNVYSAELGELDDNGIYEIIKIEYDTSDGRSNAEAIPYKHFLTWTGDGYEEFRPRERIN